MNEPDHWFEPLADHMGAAYLRYSFTQGTEQEVEFVISSLGLEPPARILDVGCGPGRHAHAFGRRGFEVVGIDISETFVRIANREAPHGVTVVRGDARTMSFDAEFDAAVSLCQGGFGLGGYTTNPSDAGSAPTPWLEGLRIESDLAVLDGIRRALRPGGRAFLSAFSSYFQVQYLDDHTRFDATSGINHEVTEVMDNARVAKSVDLWTSCFTPKELALMVAASRMHLDALYSSEPGAYARDRPTVDTPEFLVLATRPIAED